MASGIAHEGAAAAGVDRPRPLPAQALDHGAGWLAALGAIAGLRRRQHEGGSWLVQVSLARVARWIDELGRVDGAHLREPGQRDVADLLEESPSTFGRLTYVRPPGHLGGSAPRWETPPRPPGSDPPSWT
jgi:crotonobetainyl-CoA:carnitine CoA-transferase CaiB-like acyl-CoA transferase